MADVRPKEKEIVRRPGYLAPMFRESPFSMNPFALMRRFTEEMDRFLGARPFAHGELEVWSPSVEVKEVDGKLVVSAELPGLKKDEIKVSITEEALVLEGERKQEQKEEREGYYHSERHYGRFYRSIPLPKEVMADEAVAEFTHGVLEISIPMVARKQKSREIPVCEGGKVKTAAG